MSAKLYASSSMLFQILLVGLGPLSRRPTDRRVLLFGGGDVFRGDARLCITLLCNCYVGAVTPSFTSSITVDVVIVPSSAIFPTDSGASGVFYGSDEVGVLLPLPLLPAFFFATALVIAGLADEEVTLTLALYPYS